MKSSPYAGIIRIRLKGLALAISAIMGTPDFYAVFMSGLYHEKSRLSIVSRKLFLLGLIQLHSKIVYPILVKEAFLAVFKGV